MKLKTITIGSCFTLPNGQMSKVRDIRFFIDLNTLQFDIAMQLDYVSGLTYFNFTPRPIWQSYVYPVSFGEKELRIGKEYDAINGDKFKLINLELGNFKDKSMDAFAYVKVKGIRERHKVSANELFELIRWS